ncbi:MAG: DNA internalization-related competence protein ComEC/Rec2 [Acidovorax sp.]
MSPISAPNAAHADATGNGGGSASARESWSAADGPGASAARQWLVPAWLTGLVVGAALQLQQPALWHEAAYAAWAIAGAAAAVACRAAAQVRAALRWRHAVHGLALLAAIALMFAVCGLRAHSTLADRLEPSLEGRDLRITAVVAAMPQVNEAGTRLRLAVESARLEGAGPVRLPPLIDVAWYAGAFRESAGEVALQRQPQPLRAGERWEMTVRLKAPHGLSNPHGFDFELWAWEQGVQATGYIRAGARDAPPLRLGATWRHPVEQLRQSVRDAIVERLVYASDSDDPARARIAGVVAALVTGDQRAIDRADWDVFRATGVAHLMSISGLHITLFAWLAALCVGALWRRSTRLCLAVPAPSAALVAGVLLATAYALFSGWGVPAQRTVIMLGTITLLSLSGRRWPWPQVWLLACAAVVVADPWALAQAGFWLSFVAVGILFATSSIAENQVATSVMRHFQALLREQWVVTLALTPLTLLLFGQISVVGFAANLVAIPWVTLVVTPLALGGMVWAPLWSLAALGLQPLAALLQWLAQWPWAVVFVPAAPWWAGAAAVLGGVLLAMQLPWRLRLLALPLLIPVIGWQPARPAAGQFELLAADIGQGNAVLVRTASHTLLYDAGPRFSRESDAGHRVLVPLLRALGEEVDLLMLSHRDADHTGGAAAVLAQQPLARVTGSLEADHALQWQRPVAPGLAGQRWQWDGVDFEVLHPLGGDDAAAVKPNALSCVLRISATAGSRASALLVGDIEAAQEAALVARAAPSLRADWLLVPHHGSKTSSSAAFLDAVQPRTALVQAGYRNRFGHPAPAVAARYRERGIALVESSVCGAATWRSSEPDRPVCERDQSRRYWHHRPGA